MTTAATTQGMVRSVRIVVLVAWGVMLLASALPDVIRQELIQPNAAGSLLWAKLAMVVALLAVGVFWRPLGLLRSFLLLLLLTLVAVELLTTTLDRWAWWQARFGGEEIAFTREMTGVQLRRLMVALSVIAGLRLMGFSRTAMFLTPGQLNAPITPVPQLGFPRADAWTRFGGVWAVAISLGTLTFLILGARPSPSLWVQALPMLPLILLLATMNAFSEEMIYRASWLATLMGPVGPRHALWLSALFFGLGHYYGVPYGIVGVAMATFLGWLLGKSMLETSGFFWAWLIHFLQDVLIFTFMAVGSITPGGG